MTGFITLFLFFLLQVRSWMEELLIGINRHIVSYTIGLDSLKASSNGSNCVEDIRLRMDGLFEQKEHALLFVKEFTALYTNGPAGGGGIRLMHTHNYCPFLKCDYLKFVYIVISFIFTVDLSNWIFHTILYTNHLITNAKYLRIKSNQMPNIHPNLSTSRKLLPLKLNGSTTKQRNKIAKDPSLCHGREESRAPPQTLNNTFYYDSMQPAKRLKEPISLSRRNHNLKQVIKVLLLSPTIEVITSWRKASGYFL